MSEECVVGSDFRIARPELYSSYKEWCPTVTRSPLSARRFNERVKSLLSDASSAVVTVNGTEHWKGITLSSLAPPDVSRMRPAHEQGDQFEGGERVAKVEEVSYPLSPEVEEPSRKGIAKTSTLSTQHPPDPRCRLCRKRMSVARVSDVCGTCKAWGVEEPGSGAEARSP